MPAAVVYDAFGQGDAPGGVALPACLVLERGDYSLSDWSTKLQRYACTVQQHHSSFYHIACCVQACLLCGVCFKCTCWVRKEARKQTEKQWEVGAAFAVVTKCSLLSCTTYWLLEPQAVFVCSEYTQLAISSATGCPIGAVGISRLLCVTSKHALFWMDSELAY